MRRKTDGASERLAPSVVTAGGRCLVSRAVCRRGWSAPELVTQVAHRCRPSGARSDAHGRARSAAAVSLSGRVELAAAVAVLSHRVSIVGLAALVLARARLWRGRATRSISSCWLYGVATFVATIGQNRFGYYLVTACALLGGWLADQILDVGCDATAPSRALAAQIAAVLVAGAMFAPNLAPRSAVASNGDARRILAGRDDVAASRDAAAVPRRLQEWGTITTSRAIHEPRPASRLHGDELVGSGLLADPSARGACRFRTRRRNARSMPRASMPKPTNTEPSRVAAGRARAFVLSDWELPFRMTPEGTIMGRFQNVARLGRGNALALLRGLLPKRESGWAPVWVFHEPVLSEHGVSTHRAWRRGGDPVECDHACSSSPIAWTSGLQVSRGDRAANATRPTRMRSPATVAAWQAARTFVDRGTRSDGRPPCRSRH